MTTHGWAMTLLVASLMAAVLYLSSSVLTPFVAGLVLAYILSPMVCRLHQAGLPRSLASALPVVLVIVLVGLAIAFLLPMLVQQTGGFLQKLPAYLNDLQSTVISPRVAKLLKLKTLNADAMIQSFGALSAGGAGWVAANLARLYSGAVATFNMVMLLVMTPLVAFYLVHDWPDLEPRLLRALPERWRATVVDMVDKIDVRLSAYLRGQLMVCLVAGLYYATALELAGLELGWALGMLAGVLVFIPVVGALMAVCLMLGMAVVQYQFSAWEPYALVASIYALGQALESSVLTPVLVGNRVGLHPVWVIFALLAGGEIAGISGMLLAVPVAIVVSVMLPYMVSAWHRAVR